MIIILIISLLLSLKLFVLWFQQPCSKTERPATVPLDARWAGGCDGGVWIQTKEQKKDQLRLRIYHDSRGDLIKDGWFSINKSCQGKPLTSAFGAFDGDNIYLPALVDSGGQSCFLHSLQPDLDHDPESRLDHQQER